MIKEKMAFKSRKDLSTIKKITVILYLLYRFLVGSFIQYNVNDETLEGSINLALDGSYISVLLSTVLLCGLLYFFLKGNKLVTTLIFLGGFMNIIFALMMIETSNFSMYNVTLIINIIISLLTVFFLRPRI